MRKTRPVQASLLAMAMVAAVLNANLVTPAVVHASRAIVLDDWLAAHGDVANAIIWEFPPHVQIGAMIPEKPILWSSGFGVAPSLIAALDLAVFPESALSDRVLRSDDPLALLVEGMDRGRIVSAYPARGGGWSLSKAARFADVLATLPGGIKKSEYGAEIRQWSTWPEPAKQQLRDHFAAYEQWAQGACALYEDYAASGFSVKPVGFDAAFSSVADTDPSPIADPPLNLNPADPLVDGSFTATLESSSAFALYVRLVAAQLAMEIGGCLPWSVTDYAAADLSPLFDGRSIFRYVPAGPTAWGLIPVAGHVVATTVTPAPPLIVLGFLAQNGLIAPTRGETVMRLLHWEREHLVHVVGGTANPPLSAGDVYFGYNGRAPVSRMINGTIMAAPLYFGDNDQFAYFDQEMRHWVGGCGGSSGFSPEILRTVNIAAHRTIYDHFQNRFALGSGLYVGISHADDPYGIKDTPEISTGELLLDNATFQAWFANEADPAVVHKNVGRRRADLNLQYLPLTLLKAHCIDLFLGNDHANSRVAQRFITYSVAELEAFGLWTNMDTKLATLGGCAAIGT